MIQKDVYKHSVEYTASSLPRNTGKLGYQFYFSNYRAPEVFIFMRIKLPETKNTINVSYTYSVTIMTTRQTGGLYQGHKPR